MGAPDKYLPTGMSFCSDCWFKNLVTEISFWRSSSSKLDTAESSKRKLAIAASRNFVTVMSFVARYLVTAVSFADKNLVTVTSRNFVTEMSLVSRKRVEAVPRYLDTARSLYRNLVTEMSLASRNLVTVISLVSRK